jgi:hypothetical protein
MSVTSPPGRTGTTGRAGAGGAGAALADVLAIVVFALIGRASHAEGVTAVGAATTALPFLAGALLGWSGLLAGRMRPESLPAGACVVAGAIAGGMTLRRLTGGGTPVSFVLVATTVVSVFLLGWRAALMVARLRRH